MSRTLRPGPGAAPGTVAVDPHAHATVVDLFGYGPDGYVEEKNVTPDRVVECLASWPITWVNVEGLADAGVLRRLADIFRLHPLVRDPTAPGGFRRVVLQHKRTVQRRSVRGVRRRDDQLAKDEAGKEACTSRAPRDRPMEMGSRLTVLSAMQFRVRL